MMLGAGAGALRTDASDGSEVLLLRKLSTRIALGPPGAETASGDGSGSGEASSAAHVESDSRASSPALGGTTAPRLIALLALLVLSTMAPMRASGESLSLEMRGNSIAEPEPDASAAASSSAMAQAARSARLEYSELLCDPALPFFVVLLTTC